MKNINYFFVVLIGSLLCTSCDVIHFNRYPGVKLDTIPAAYRGEFEAILKTKKSGEADTTIFFVGKNSFTSIEKDKVDITFLSDSVVFSVVDNNYYLSERLEGLWTVNAVRLAGKDILVTVYEAKGKNDDQKVNILKKYFPNVELEKGSTVKRFKADMKEEQLKKYQQKALKKSSIKLRRVQE